MVASLVPRYTGYSYIFRVVGGAVAGGQCFFYANDDEVRAGI